MRWRAYLEGEFAGDSLRPLCVEEVEEGRAVLPGSLAGAGGVGEQVRVSVRGCREGRRRVRLVLVVSALPGAGAEGPVGRIEEDV